MFGCSARSCRSISRSSVATKSLPATAVFQFARRRAHGPTYDADQRFAEPAAANCLQCYSIMCISLFSGEHWLALRHDRCPTLQTQVDHITRVCEGQRRALGAPYSPLSFFRPSHFQRWFLLHRDSCRCPGVHAWHRYYLSLRRDVEQSHPAAKATEDNRMLCTLKDVKKGKIPRERTTTPL